MKKKLTTIMALGYFVALGVVVGTNLSQTSEVRQEIQNLRSEVSFVEHLAQHVMTKDETQVTKALRWGQVACLNSTRFDDPSHTEEIDHLTSIPDQPDFMSEVKRVEGEVVKAYVCFTSNANLKELMTEDGIIVGVNRAAKITSVSNYDI